MCFIISIVLLVLSYNFFITNNILLAIGALTGSIIFIVLMIKNIQYVKKLKREKR
jgi:hypothetical protein